MDIWEVKKNNFGLYEIYTRSKVFVCQIGSMRDYHGFDQYPY